MKRENMPVLTMIRIISILFPLLVLDIVSNSNVDSDVLITYIIISYLVLYILDIHCIVNSTNPESKKISDYFSRMKGISLIHVITCLSALFLLSSYIV